MVIRQGAWYGWGSANEEEKNDRGIPIKQGSRLRGIFNEPFGNQPLFCVLLLRGDGHKLQSPEICSTQDHCYYENSGATTRECATAMYTQFPSTLAD